MRRRRSVMARAALAFGAGALAVACGTGSEGANRYHGFVLAQPQAKVDFTLTDDAGHPFDFRRETDGHVTLLFFGYTHCPDVCPVTMSNLGAALARLSPDVRDRIKVVFVSTDPERDTGERLRSWLDNFDRSFIGLRGPADSVNAIMGSLGLPPAIKEKAGSGGGYTVGHAARVLAFTADNRLRLMYSPDTRQVDWVYDLSRLAKGAEPGAPSS